MKNIEKKDKIQKKALQAWVNSGKKGSVEIITGLGKSFIFLHALYTMPLGKKQKHLFLAEVVDRERDMLVEIEKYNKIFNRDVFGDYNLEFGTYQGACKWRNKTFGLIGADEMPDSLTPIYSNFYRYNIYNAIIGLAAYFDINTHYEDINMTKGDLLNMIAPICYRYHLDQGLEEGVARKLNIHIIKHKLDSKNKNIRAGSVKKPFYQTEQKAYKYWNGVYNKNLNPIYRPRKEGENLSEHILRINKVNDKRQLKIRVAIGRRSKILYDLPSKILLTKQILSKIEGQVIIFGNSIPSLLKITKNTVSSKNSEKQNNLIRDAFNDGDIKYIGSFKKLKQGANLSENLNNTLLMSYYSKQKDLIQRAGRLRDNGKVGNMFIIVTEDTQEEVWLEKMFEGINNYDIKIYNNIKEFLK